MRLEIKRKYQDQSSHELKAGPWSGLSAYCVLGKGCLATRSLKKKKDRGVHTSHCVGPNFGHMRQLSLGESSSLCESDLTGESAEREYLETCEQRAVRERIPLALLWSNAERELDMWRGQIF